MRVATMAIALVLSMLVLLQSCTVSVGGSMAKNEGLAQGGAIGVLLALLYLIGGAFALGVPIISVVAFLLGGLIALAVVASNPAFADLQVLGWVAIALAVVSFFGHREKRRSAS
jgi:hypothetical protein